MLVRLFSKPIPGKHVRPKSRKRKVIVRTLVVTLVAAMVTIAAGAGYTVWGIRSLDQAIARFRIHRPSGKYRDVTPTTPQVFLLLGSDSREGRNQDFKDKSFRGIQGGGGADSIILVRIDPNSKKTEMVSVHRDLRVNIPGHGLGKINSAYELGGPSLMVQVVEQVTNTHIDHVGVVDFAGFTGIVDTVGGVDLCLTEAQRDKYTGLDMPAGCTEVDGQMALAYARSRHAQLCVDHRWQDDLTDDYGRMKRQQAFLRALAKKAASPTQLVNLPGLAGAVKGFVAADDRLDVRAALGLANRLSSHTDNVATASLPVSDRMIGGASFAILDAPAAAALMADFNAGTMPDHNPDTDQPGPDKVGQTPAPAPEAPGATPAPSPTNEKAKPSAKQC